ncbi:MAG: hypothetical protein EBX52_08595 [Proteobacteria bacterium]|nr:hypothetical protein [Pseudomonadota bacterium]
MSSPWDTFYSLYYESAYLDRAGTGAGLFVPRFGITDPSRGLEVYVTSRVGVDSRTFLEQSDQIYNDNFLFIGMGVDQVTWIKGVRFSLQTGSSIDLNPKINLGGFDVRAGFMSWHELEWIPRSLRTEIYSEAFYVRRYRNTLGSLQLRNFWPVLTRGSSRYEGLELGPELEGVISGDTVGYDYNRFVEGIAGVRLQIHTPLSIALHVLGVRGQRLESGSPIGAYTDFRLLLTGYFGSQ